MTRNTVRGGLLHIGFTVWGAVAFSSAVAQCVWSDPQGIAPANACCDGSISGVFYPAAGPQPFWVRFTNVDTEVATLHSVGWNGVGWDYSRSKPPGTYFVEALQAGYEPCADWTVTVPSHQPEDAMTAALGVAHLANDICGSGQVSVGFTRPSSTCLPVPTAQLVHSGGIIPGLLDGDTMRFSGVPASGTITVNIFLGCLNATVNVPTDQVPCPSLGGEPTIADATVDMPGRISGTAPIVGCAISVAIVAVGGGSVAVTWDDPQQWHADVPAGQYAVVLGVGGGQVCVEEYVVEVEDAPCDIVLQSVYSEPQSIFNVENGKLRFIFEGDNAVSINVEIVHTPTQEVFIRNGTAGMPIEIDELFSGQYTGTYRVVALGCEVDMGTMTIPCGSGAFRTLYGDEDGDGDGNPNDQIEVCIPRSGYISDPSPTDCDDSDPLVRDGVLVRLDVDGDGYGVGSVDLVCGVLPSILRPVSVLQEGDDCDDGDAEAYGPLGAPCTDCSNCEQDCTVRTGCGCVGDPKPDTDGDGICDDEDDCDAQPNPIGSTCNDNNPQTTDDRVSADCECVGVCPNGNRVGTSCSDDDPCSSGDVWTVNCTCEGTVPQGTGAVGDECDDDNNTTTGDVLNDECTCVGTPCAEDMRIHIMIKTDAHGEDIAWTVRHNASGETVCSGNTLDDNSTVTDGCCMQAGGCYKLTVTDAGGNGIYRGGYVVRMGGANGPRLIDNTDNFRTGSVSTMSGLESFCYAMGPVALASRSCDKMNWVKGQQLACDEHPSVTAAYINGAPLASQSTTVGYEFWIFDPNGSFSQHYFRSHAMANQRVWAGPGRAAHLPINQWDAAVAPHIPGNKLLNVRVRPVYPGSTDAYGPACRFMLDPSREECPITSLVDNPSSFQHSCNVQRSRRNGLNFPNWVYADAIHHPLGEIGFQDRYQFRFRNVADGYDTTLTSNSSHISLAWRERPLQVGHTYDVDVRVSTDGGATWCASSEPGGSWGAVCSVTIVENGSGLAPEDGTLTDDAVDVLLYPDPVTEGQLYIHTTGLPPQVERVDVDIHSITGERVRSQQLPATAGMVHTRLELPADMASGVYLVVLTAEGQRWTRRVVIQ